MVASLHLRKVHLVYPKKLGPGATTRAGQGRGVSPLRVEERQGRHHAASRAVRCEFQLDARPALRPAPRGL